MSNIKDHENFSSMTDVEHMLKRPDTYIGGISPVLMEKAWIYEEKKDMFIQKDICISEGFCSVFNEILTNASDQCLRTREHKKKDSDVQITKAIKVCIDEKGFISIYNDGDGIPVKKDEKSGMWIPEMVFGKVRTSSNYDDKKKKTWGGKNGVGAKIANVYSKEFKVETVDHRRKKKFSQTWKENMSSPKKEASITSYSQKPYTKISFMPDYARFGMPSGMDENTLSYLRKRVYDIAGCTSRDVSVYFNKKKLDVKTFAHYAEKFIGKDEPKIIEKPNDRWEIIVSTSPHASFEQISIVNGIHTVDGGSHVKHVANQICRKMAEKLKGVKPTHIMKNLRLFVNCLIEDPAFSSQTKRALKTSPSRFGSCCNISNKCISQLLKSDVVEKSRMLKDLEHRMSLKKTDGKKTKSIRGIAKLDDANWAGTKRSKDCVLILTEGDSAKSLIISGLGVVGRDRYGVFPLKGKLLNTRNASLENIRTNEEIQNIKKILGLKETTQNVSELRYGKVLIMTDQDYDGSHIKGLVMNFLDVGWPSLVDQGFLTTYYTPLVKIRKKDKVVASFYNTVDYENWKEENDVSKYNVKYYKGLGTSTKKEAQEYFKRMSLIQMGYGADKAISRKMLDVAFNKEHSDKRKVLLSHYNPQNTLDYTSKVISGEEYVKKELVHFSNYSNERAIPNFLDGLKPSQRKVLYTVQKKNVHEGKGMKVSQLSGYVSAETAYHHGEASIQGTIQCMAQDFVGSNNINVLRPNGMFGTRLHNGKDCAQPRYIYTHMESIANMIYRKEDTPLLVHLTEEGQSIEPKFYVPIIPMVLVNKTNGIGTGYSSMVPNYCPFRVIDNLRRLMDGKKVKRMAPWYRKFKGKYVKKNNKWYTQGLFEIKNNKVIINELPVGLATEKFHAHLESLTINSSEKNMSKRKKQCVIDYKKCNDQDDETVHLEIKFNAKTMELFRENPEKLVQLLKLEESKSGSTTNMYLKDPVDRIMKFRTSSGIIRSFYRIRLRFYEMRRRYNLIYLERELRYIRAQLKFVKSHIEGSVVVSKKSDEKILETLRENIFPPNPMKDKIEVFPISRTFYVNALFNDAKKFVDESGDQLVESEPEDLKSDCQSEISGATEESELGERKDVISVMIHQTDVDWKSSAKAILKDWYSYLLQMPIWSLTKSKVLQLEQLLSKKEKELEDTKRTTPKDMWKKELDVLEAEIRKFYR